MFVDVGIYKAVHQRRHKRCYQQLKVRRKLLLFSCHEHTDRQTERQTDRQTDKPHELHVYVGLAQARPN